MKISKVVWNTCAVAGYNVAKVGEALVNTKVTDLPTVVSIDERSGNEGVFITMSDEKMIWITHPDEVYYVPK